MGDREVYLWGAPVELARTDRIKTLRDRLLNQLVLNAYRFDYDWEMAEGMWRFQVVHRGRVIAEKAIKVVVVGQNPSGGWTYNCKPSDRNDTSYMGWCAQALKAAKADTEPKGEKE